MKTKSNLETKLVSQDSVSRIWVVILGGREVGTVQKFTDLPGDSSPYVVYRGIGRAARFAGHTDTLRDAAALAGN